VHDIQFSTTVDDAVAQNKLNVFLLSIRTFIRQTLPWVQHP